MVIDLAPIVARARVANLAPAPTGASVRRMLVMPAGSRGVWQSLQKRMQRQVARKDARAFLVTFSATFVSAMVFLI